MGVRVECVRCGRPAVDALRARIAAIKGTEPLAPVTAVVVPSNHVGVATRRLFASGALGPARLISAIARARRATFGGYLIRGS